LQAKLYAIHLYTIRVAFPENDGRIPFRAENRVALCALAKPAHLADVSGNLVCRTGGDSRVIAVVIVIADTQQLWNAVMYRRFHEVGEWESDDKSPLSILQALRNLYRTGH
jgi:hypothetical protein